MSRCRVLLECHAQHLVEMESGRLGWPASPLLAMSTDPYPERNSAAHHVVASDRALHVLL